MLTLTRAPALGLCTALVTAVAFTSAAEGQEYKEEWSSLVRHETPEWFRDAKFGIYTHLSPVTLATTDGMAGWYGNKMYQQEGSTRWTGAKTSDGPTREFQYHRERWGDQNQFGYKDVCKEFQPERFDAEAWADLFERSGAKFAGPVGIHHDNYAMWDSQVTRWNSKRLAGVDVTGELEKAIRARGMRFMMSFHHAFSWWYFAPSYKFDGGKPGNEDLYCRPHTFSPDDDSFAEYPDAEYEQLWYAKLNEACEKYRPDLVWFDMGLELLSENIRKKAFARIYNLADQRDQDVGISYKIKYHAPMPLEAGILDYERGRSDSMRADPWLTDTSTAAWFYTAKRKARPAGELVDILIDIVSKNGCMLLNVGPKADGTIPEDSKRVLLEIGAWLDVNGEGIYATRPWTIAGEGPTQLAEGGHFAEQDGFAYTAEDIRFTRSKDGRVLYVLVMDKPASGEVIVSSLASGSGQLDRHIESVSMLGSNANITWSHDADGLHLSFPVAAKGEHAFVWKLTLGETSQATETQQFPAVMPDEKPTDRELSASWSRMWDRWNPHEDRGNELYSNFKYTPLEGFTREPNVSRRDPSKVLKINDTYYVWYTCRRSEFPPAGLKEATNTVPGTDWDLADIWYATSKDGFTWEERGPAVKRPKAPTQGFRSICTPDVLHWNGRYYLYFQAYSPMVGGQAWCPVMAAVADSPDGPWMLVEKPVIEPGPPGSWDNIKINDPYLLVYQGEIWMYYKGAPVERGDGYVLRMQGAASADDPLGPFTKSPLNPVINSGHETCMWPWKSGVAALVALDGPEKNTIQYAVDGENFEIASIIQMPPIAPGPFIPDAFADSGDGRGITWGLCHINPDGGGATNESILARFDCDLSQDADRPLFKRNNLRFEESTYFQTRVRLPDNLRRMIDHERVKTDRDTIRPLP